VRKTPAGERGQRFDQVEAIGFELVPFFAASPDDALHQQPVGITDIQERPITDHRRDNRTPGHLPTPLVTTKSRTPARIF